MKTLFVAFLVVLASFSALRPIQGQEKNHVISSGQFVGKSDHKTSGRASIIQAKDGTYFVVLGKNFSLDGAPDPKVALGNDGYQKEGLLGKLESKNGRQMYRIPADLDPANFNEIWIWCEKFSVPLGLAKLG